MRALLVAVAAAIVLMAQQAQGVAASVAPMPAYMPTEMVHSILTPTQVRVVLGELSEYSLDEALLQMPRFKKKGAVKLPESNATMLGVWASETAAYNLEHGTSIRAVAVFNANLRPKGLNLEDPATRSRMVAAIEGVLTKGIEGVQLDVEPYPTSAGYIALLEAVDVALARRGLAGRLSVAAPGDIQRWSPGYTRRVGELVGEMDPLYYDSESTEPGEYEEWVEKGLAYETANVPAGTAIVPIIPSYRANPWHLPAVENIANASTALRESLAQGARVTGAGIWWWYGFFEAENGRYKSAVADRAAWLGQTLALPFSA
jgi:hypothetical protein